MPTPLYVFDMDDTLIDGDCAMIWSEYLADKGIASDPDFVAQDRLIMSRYASGEMDMEDYLDFAMQPLLTLPTEQVQRLADDCVATRIVPRLFPQAKALIKQLTDERIQMLIISASVSFLVKAVARKIGVAEAMGIDMVIEKNHYTTHIWGTPTYREGKVTRLNEWLAERPQYVGQVHFFTDSINDLPLCLHADFTYLVNPCTRLIQYAQPQQWPILKWG